MVKSKKLSRGSLAVLLLALLLSLSMMVGLTGAWFTDKSQQRPDATIGTFGKVDINATTMAVTEAQDVDLLHLLPGDSFDFSGSIDVQDATVKMYVQIEISTAFYVYVGNKALNEVLDNEWTQYCDLGTREANPEYGTGDAPQYLYDTVISYTPAELVTENAQHASQIVGWTKVKDLSSDVAGTGKLYTYDPTTANKNTTVTFTGGLEFLTSMPNEVYGRQLANDKTAGDWTASPLALNDVVDSEGHPTNAHFKIVASLVVKAIQYKGLEETQTGNSEYAVTLAQLAEVAF